MIWRPLIGVIDIPRPLRYFSDYPKIAFKIPIPGQELVPKKLGQESFIGSLAAVMRNSPGTPIPDLSYGIVSVSQLTPKGGFEMF